MYQSLLRACSFVLLCMIFTLLVPSNLCLTYGLIVTSFVAS